MFKKEETQSNAPSLATTERRQSKEALGESEELYRSMIELSPDSIFAIDTKGVITLCNTAATRLLGYSKDELIGKHFSKLGTLKLRDTPKYLKVFRSVLGEKAIEPMEVTFYHKDRTIRRVDVRVNSLKIGGKTIIQTTARDITERKRVEESLQESNENIRAIFENLNDVIIRLDKYGNIMEVSSGLKNMFGYELDEVVGKNFTKLNLFSMKDLPKMVKLFTNGIRGNVERFTEVEFKRKDGSTFFSEISTGLAKRDTKIKGMIAVVRDITERNRMERELEEKNEQLDALNEELRAQG